MRTGSLRAGAIALGLQVTLATAGGFEFADHGGAAMGRGGSAVASTEGPSAIYYNPAGLADLDGLRLSIDGELAIQNTSFQRTIDDGSGTFTNFGDVVSNGRSLWIAPFATASYQIIPDLTVAVAGFGPSAFAWQRYPDPRVIQPEAWDGDFDNDPADLSPTETGAPQRYNLINSDILLAFPSVAVAWRPFKYLSLGATGQLLTGSTAFSMAITAGFVPSDDPGADAIASLSVKVRPVFIGILGVQVHPIDDLSLGFSWRPGFSSLADGTLDIHFADALLSLVDLEQTENGAIFESEFPDVLRFGIAYSGKGWLAEVGGTYETWSRLESFNVKTDDVVVWLGDSQIEVPEIIIPKNWSDTFSVRIGGRFELGQLLGKDLPLTLRAGYVYESGAVPDSTMALDFISTDRNQITLGASYGLGPITVNLAATRIFQPSTTVTTSEVPQVAPLATQTAMIGNGTYKASTTLLILGVEGHFLAND